MKIIYIIPILYLFFPLQNAQAEISSKIFLDEIFNGCMEDSLEELPLRMHYEYCGCYVNGISQILSLEEAIRLGLDIERVGDDDEAVLDLIFENEEVTNVIIECAGKIL
tara:strand:- start:243 stop:569 length:327 start_codon:yes stop_codon:yes gene_type:complete